MKKRNEIKISLGVTICIVIIVILIVILSILSYLYFNKNDNINNSTYKNTTINAENANIKQNEKTKELSFEENMIDYIIKSIKTYSNNGMILKSTTGDVESEKLTSQEVDENYNIYKDKISQLLKDNKIFSSKFILKNKESCTYNFEKILNNLDLGTHMGIGIGNYDSNNNKLYYEEMTEVDELNLTNSNIIKHFGYNANQLIDDVLNKIENYTNNGYILKSTIGDVTTPKLTKSEFDSNKENYKKVIKDALDDIGIFSRIEFDNGKLICKCAIEKLLNKLELGTHMGVGTDIDNEDNETFILSN